MIRELAAAIGACIVAQSAAPQTLIGIAVGANAKDVVAAHRGTAVAPAPWGPSWTWKAPAGIVRVTADEAGNVGIVDVVLAPATATIDLPAAAAFPANGGHTKYTAMSSYVESDACTATAGGTCFAYTLDDGELVLQFGPNDALHEAIWGDRQTLKTLNLIQPGPSL